MNFQELQSVLPSSDFSRLEEIYQDLIRGIPTLATENKLSSTIPIEKRLSVGLAKQNNKYVLILMVVKEDSWASRKADEFENKYQNQVVHAVSGIAYASRPENKMNMPKAELFEPGLSIGALRGFAGTLGCIVKVRDDSEDWRGVTSAAHVLALSKEARERDAIIIPGFPDGARVKKNAIGTLENYTLLVHHSDDDANISALNTSDIAVVKVDEQKTIKLPDENLVPAPDDPSDPAKKIKITGIVENNHLFAYLGKSVYKIGRTTGFTEGILFSTNHEDYSISLPNGKNYAYSNVSFIASKGKNSFSSNGDSGALVYSSDGQALGFIIGGTASFSIMISISSCLSEVEAGLLI